MATAAISSHGELALGEDVQHFAPDVARRADDDYPITHCQYPLRIRKRPVSWWGAGRLGLICQI